MGCGKTTIGKKLSKELRQDFIDCDEYLEKKYNITISECFAISEKYFRDLETECIEELSKFERKIISTGGGIILKSENMDFLKNDTVIFINRPLENILRDIDNQNRPLIKNDKEKLVTLYNERIGLYKKYCNFEILNNSTIEDVIEKIKMNLWFV